MLQQFGVDLLSPDVSLRRVHVLINRLAPGTVPRSETAAAWTVESHLLADLYDAISALLWTTQQVNSKSRVREPKPHPRPGAQPAATGNKVPWSKLGDVLRGEGAVIVDG